MHADNTCDIAIFGAGIAGASAGYRVAQQRDTVLIEREPQPGYHSTGRSAAMFMETYGPPIVRALTRASREFYEHPPQGFTAQRLLSPRGAMYLASPGQEDLMERTRAEMIATCPALQSLDREAVLARVNCLRPERVHGALLDGDAQDIDAGALHQGFLRGFRQRGGTLRTGTTLVGATRAGAVWELRFADGDLLRARTVVNAAGAWADEFAGMFGARPIGLVPHRRTAFTFKAPEDMAFAHWPLVCGIDETWYFKPDAGQLLGSPANADPTVAHDVMPEELDVAKGIAEIEAVSTLTIRRPTSTWAGLRSFVRDGELVLGHDSRCPGFFWLAGQGGYGIQSAAGASELAASLLLGTAAPDWVRHLAVAVEGLAPGRLR